MAKAKNTKKLTPKQKLQREAKAAGVDFTQKTTVADLKKLIAAAGEPDPVEAREERRAADRAEAAEASANRAENEAAAKARHRTAPQQALEKTGGETREERRERKYAARHGENR